MIISIYDSLFNIAPTKGPNCFFLSVASFVSSFFPAANSSGLYTKSLTTNLCSRA